MKIYNNKKKMIGPMVKIIDSNMRRLTKK